MLFQFQYGNYLKKPLSRQRMVYQTRRISSFVLNLGSTKLAECSDSTARSCGALQGSGGDHHQ